MQKVHAKEGSVIKNLSATNLHNDLKVFHAGTAINSDGFWVSNGGRVLSVTASGITLEKAISTAYQGVEQIGWKDGYYRRDIGRRALN